MATGGEDLRAQMENLIRTGQGVNAEEEEEMYEEEIVEQGEAVKFLVDWGLRPFVAGVGLALGMSVGYTFFDNVLCLGLLRRRKD